MHLRRYCKTYTSTYVLESSIPVCQDWDRRTNHLDRPLDSRSSLCAILFLLCLRPVKNKTQNKDGPRLKKKR